MAQKVIFAIPSITGNIACETMLSVTKAILLLQHVGIESDIHTIAGCPVLDVARDTLAAMFLQESDATDHFFIDYDVAFPPEAVLKLLQRPEDVIAGAYRVKVDDHEEYSCVPKTQDGIPIGKVEGDDVLVQADFLATGFMRIKRSVYEHMQEHYPELRYEDNVIKTVNGPIKEAYDYFGMGIDTDRRRFTTEDYYFCKRWREMGGKLWIYPNVTFDHFGRKAYSGNMHEYLMRLPGGAKSNVPKEVCTVGK